MLDKELLKQAIKQSVSTFKELACWAAIGVAIGVGLMFAMVMLIWLLQLWAIVVVVVIVLLILVVGTHYENLYNAKVAQENYERRERLEAQVRAKYKL